MCEGGGGGGGGGVVIATHANQLRLQGLGCALLTSRGTKVASGVASLESGQ